MAVIALAAAERQRRFRERTRKCAAAYWVDADDRVLTMLRRRKYIEEHELEDERAVGEAIRLFVADLAEIDQA